MDYSDELYKMLWCVYVMILCANERSVCVCDDPGRLKGMYRTHTMKHTYTKCVLGGPP